MKQFKFKVGVAPDEHTINIANKCAAEILISRYGVETMKQVLEMKKALEIKKEVELEQKM